ncbi:MAG: ChaN family lipoprotein [Phycisphaerales bacterium]
MFCSNGGAAIDWQDLLEAIEWADVVILGEQHDDAVAHAVQLAVVEDAMKRYPGTALSMEMLDREEQALVDDYLADFINRDMFLEQTASTKWLRIARDYLDDEIDRETFQKRILRIGWPDWENNYQPIIDAAKEAGSPVVAANTPWLRYMSVASREGYGRLRSLTDAQKRLFARPKQDSYRDYRERFWQVMVERAEGEPPKPLEEDADEDDKSQHAQMTDEQVASAFRGQLIMDATMADSIARALHNGADKVVHLVGQFHSDFNGGTVQELRRRKRGVKILTVSMQRADAVALREQDRGRADIVIYTGEPEESEDEEEEAAPEEDVQADDESAPAPTTQPTTQPSTQPTTHPTTKPDDGSF